MFNIDKSSNLTSNTWTLVIVICTALIEKHRFSVEGEFQYWMGSNRKDGEKLKTLCDIPLPVGAVSNRTAEFWNAKINYWRIRKCHMITSLYVRQTWRTFARVNSILHRVNNGISEVMEIFEANSIVDILSLGGKNHGILRCFARSRV